MVDAVLARSQGNPLYAEELLAVNQAGKQEGVPDHLSGLLLARIDALDEGPRALLRVVSVNGTRLDTETLAELAGLDQAQMEGSLREALDANVLRQSGDYLEFRHPLLREATYDDLMPDERARIHGGTVALRRRMKSTQEDLLSNPRAWLLSRGLLIPPPGRLHPGEESQSDRRRKICGRVSVGPLNATVPLELPRHHRARSAGGGGGLAGGLPPDPAVPVVELPRRLQPGRLKPR